MPEASDHWATMTHADLISCRGHIHAALQRAMAERSTGDLRWVAHERRCVTAAANEWARKRGIDRRLSIYDVEAVEGRAMGHYDYSSKLALYVAELVVGAP